jgi:hypothetical protein
MATMNAVLDVTESVRITPPSGALDFGYFAHSFCWACGASSLTRICRHCRHTDAKYGTRCWLPRWRGRA